MPLTVLSVAYPFAPVSPCAVGGAEKVLSDLDGALVRQGHRSLVIACHGSTMQGDLLPVASASPGTLTGEDQARSRREVQRRINDTLAMHSVDIVHLHGIDFDEYAVPGDVSTVVTLHLPLSWYPSGVWARWRQARFVCVSASQQATCPPELRGCTVIPNGVDLPPLAPSSPREHFALAMGRICPEKNQHAALDAGTLAGIPVLLAGEVFPYEAHQRYFEHEIVPRLNAGNGHRMLGPVDDATRLHLLQTARCLLHPTLAPETSSLVAMEALAAGTPVIAYPSGALPDIVEDGVTGWLISSPERMADAIGRAHLLSHEACRYAAETRFRKADMTGRYLDLYAHMVGARSTLTYA